MDRLQFGETLVGRTYRDRQAAFGIVQHDGRIAIAAITLTHGEPPVFDLPGGGMDAGETESDALVREFGEEVGLRVGAGDLLLRATQRHINRDGEAIDNHGAFFEATLKGENPALKIEDDHKLVWMDPVDFIRRAHHEAQAWAVVVWLRRSATTE